MKPSIYQTSPPSPQPSPTRGEGVTLHVEIHGAGPDLALIHGWGMHGGIWDGVRDTLARRYRLHIIDLPGMGYSAPVEDYSLAHLARRIAEILPPCADLCGWSLGGQIAMQVALDHPQQVRRLLLVGSTPRFVNVPDWRHGIEAGVFRQFAANVTEDYEETMSRFLGLQAFGGEASRNQMRLLRERFAERPAPDRDTLKQALQLLLHTDLRASLAELRQPMLILHGERDTLAPADAARWTAHRLPHAQLRIIGGASHAPFLSHPASFVAEVNWFLEH